MALRPTVAHASGSEEGGWFDFHGAAHILTATDHHRSCHRRFVTMQKREKAVTFKGTPYTLVGPQLKEGDKAPDFEVLSGLEVVKLAGTPAKARLFSVVPSLDTPVCSEQTKK